MLKIDLRRGSTWAAATLALSLLGAGAACAQSAEAVSLASPQCVLTEEQKLANRGLEWSEFEFGTIDGRPMALAGRRCFREAALASRDYLTYGPLLATRQQAISTFHMGRHLAFSGQEREAAVAVSASRRSDQGPNGLDWNTYVQGVYAFLVKDAAALASALSKLGASAGDGDRTNAENLQKLQKCFNRPYLSAMSDPDCGPPPEVH